MNKAMYDGAFSLGTRADASATDDPDILLGEYYLTGTAKKLQRMEQSQVR